MRVALSNLEWSKVLVHLWGPKPSPVETFAWVLATEHPHVLDVGPGLPSPFLGAHPLSSQHHRELYNLGCSGAKAQGIS